MLPERERAEISYSLRSLEVGQGGRQDRKKAEPVAILDLSKSECKKKEYDKAVMIGLIEGTIRIVLNARPVARAQ
jgi:hypothetical protein